MRLAELSWPTNLFADGDYDPKYDIIYLRKGMSRKRTFKVVEHELRHKVWHDRHKTYSWLYQNNLATIWLPFILGLKVSLWFWTIPLLWLGALAVEEIWVAVRCKEIHNLLANSGYLYTSTVLTTSLTIFLLQNHL